MKNLKIAAHIVYLRPGFPRGFISLFAVMTIPDAMRQRHCNNLIGGLALSPAARISITAT